MKLIEVNQVNDTLAEMVALFRVELRSYKGIVSKPNIEAGREEMEEYLSAKFPVFAALVDGEYAGYVVCRIDSKVVWVESIFVKEEYRRHGVATALHSKAEEIAASYGDDTVYNYVHPNNHRMIEFLIWIGNPLGDVCGEATYISLRIFPPFTRSVRLSPHSAFHRYCNVSFDSINHHRNVEILVLCCDFLNIQQSSQVVQLLELFFT